MEKEIVVYVCPECGSAVLSQDLEKDPEQISCGCQFVAEDAEGVWFPRVLVPRKKMSLREFVEFHNQKMKELRRVQADCR